MRDKGKIIYYNIFALLFTLSVTLSFAQPVKTDSIKEGIDDQTRYEQFYDSLRIKAQKSKVTRLLHNSLIHAPKQFVDKKSISLNYFGVYRGKTISKVEIKSLEVFGPSLTDTSKIAKSKLEKLANKIHTKTNLNIIRKNLLFKEGDFLDPDVIYENERIIRQLPFIRDVRMILEADSINENLVEILVLTKDVFSFGVTGNAEGEKANFEIFNRNVFGAGHEISARMVGHLRKEPYFGVETYYSINNINGKFINVSAGFSNTYKREGFGFQLEKEFITPSTKWGGGLLATRLTRTGQIVEDDPVKLEETELDLLVLDGWAGRTIQIHPGSFFNSQITVLGRISHQYFHDRPEFNNGDEQYFSNRTFYMLGLTWSQRKYVRDQLVYSYGITEDIPEGFRNELAVGYDANEFGDRLYAHLNFSNSNLLPGRPGYLYFSSAIGGYFKNLIFEQGIIQTNLQFISRLMDSGNKQCRFFGGLNYTLGIRRYELENLTLRYGHIRGFSSSRAEGKQRLSLNLETVFFQQKEIYKFYIATFLFADVGIIGSNKRFIFNQDYYTGLGFGIRLHNESLMLKTIQLRLAFYPFHPENMGFVGFDAGERTKQRFYSFQPTAPETLRFQ